MISLANRNKRYLGILLATLSANVWFLLAKTNGLDWTAIILSLSLLVNLDGRPSSWVRYGQTGLCIFRVLICLAMLFSLPMALTQGTAALSIERHSSTIVVLIWYFVSTFVFWQELNPLGNQLEARIVALACVVAILSGLALSISIYKRSTWPDPATYPLERVRWRLDKVGVTVEPIRVIFVDTDDDVCLFTTKTVAVKGVKSQAVSPGRTVSLNPGSLKYLQRKGDLLVLVDFNSSSGFDSRDQSLWEQNIAKVENQ